MVQQQTCLEIATEGLHVRVEKKNIVERKQLKSHLEISTSHVGDTVSMF